MSTPAEPREPNSPHSDRLANYSAALVGAVKAADNMLLEPVSPAIPSRRRNDAMWSPVVLATLALAPAQQPTGGLEMKNVRLTVGELGPPRPSNKLLPGDLLFISYDIEGLSIEPDGTAKYTMAMEVLDAAGKPIIKQDPRELLDFVPLRGNRVPARAFVTIGLDQAAGACSCKITVTDPRTKASNSMTVKFEVLKRDFGIVAVYTTHDERAEYVAPTTGVVGQTIFVQFSVASFMRDPKTKQPNVEF